MDKKIRCDWVGNESLMVSYHDNEWGVPVHEDRVLFEFLILEGAQAGLSWKTILNKRDNYRKAFDSFEPEIIARYKTDKINTLLLNIGIIRNKLKISATVQNAKAFLAITNEFGSFNTFLWQFVHQKSIKHAISTVSDYPVKSEESEAMSKELLKRGFKFVGPTICYAFMQAVGMVNDHQLKCFRYSKV